MKKFLKLVYSVFLVLVTNILCGEITREGILLWYNSTPKTAITPPNVVFPIVWSILYLLLAIYLFLLLTSSSLKESWKAHSLFILQLCLQLVWCQVFFGEGMLFYGLIVLIIADFTIVALIRETKNLGLKLYYLLYPYLIWMVYATLINLSYVYENGEIVVF